MDPVADDSDKVCEPCHQTSSELVNMELFLNRSSLDISLIYA